MFINTYIRILFNTCYFSLSFIKFILMYIFTFVSSISLCQIVPSFPFSVLSVSCKRYKANHIIHTRRNKTFPPPPVKSLYKKDPFRQWARQISLVYKFCVTYFSALSTVIINIYTHLTFIMLHSSIILCDFSLSINQYIPLN